MKKDVTKEYSNGEITIVWKPGICAHAAICTGLGNVFDPKKRPWINADGASTAEIAAQIDKCPSGALSYYYNEDENKAVQIIGDTKVEVSPNGPLLIYGNITIKHKDGTEEEKHKVTALCRCGASGNKPYCDGSHIKADFQDE
ncbi:MAG: (4Fe-4S)-binding protein [Saprospiraceae bacterium]|nr:(4Fe-4S)-binding protein [Saprospiraceae bacterium]